MSLSPDEIAALLKTPQRRGKKSTPSHVVKNEETGKFEVVKGTGAKPYPRPVQFGPLRMHDDFRPCARGRCGSSTTYSINGIRYCSTHALDLMNKMLMDTDPKYIHRFDENASLEDCTCKAGTFHFGRIHTDDCALHPQHKSEEALSDK
jgi:hypothetical protein